MTFTNKTYDVLKWIAQYLLPAIGTLYFALAKLWGFPYAEEVVGTISALDIFLGTLLGISSHYYEGDGNIDLTGDDLEGESQIELYDTLEEIMDRGKVMLIVKK